MWIDHIKSKKGKEKIVMLTCYDYQMAKILNKSSIDMVLVGDSLGMVFKGDKDTRGVTMDDMLYHLSAVRKGISNKPVIVDMPVNTYRDETEALKNAKLFIDRGADGVKIEGNHFNIIRCLVDEGINVMGHTGLLPQTYRMYRVVGRRREEYDSVLKDAISIERAGAFSIVLESVPEKLGKEVTESVSVPTIGIGAGRYCDGQVLVINDLLGMDIDFKPKFVKRYALLHDVILKAVEEFSEDVRSSRFPSEDNIYK